MTAIAYTRVSTADQADNGVSLDAQRARIKAYCEVYGIEVREWVEDAGESAKSLDRPGIQRVIEAMRGKSVDAVIVVKLDRLTRSVRDLADILDLTVKTGVSLISVEEKLDTGSAAGRMILNIMASVSQWEREAIGERTRAALQHKKACGERVGSVPYGYDVDKAGKLVPNEDEQHVILRMSKLRKEGGSLNGIAYTMNKARIKAKKGGYWTAQQVKNALACAGGVASCSPS